MRTWATLLRTAVACVTAATGLIVLQSSASATGSAQLRLTPSTKTVAPGQTYSLQERVTIAGDTANAVEADVLYNRLATDYLGTNDTGGAFRNPRLFAFGGGGRTSYVGGDFGSGVSGNQLVATVSFRARCVPGTITLKYDATSAVVSGTTNADLLTGTSPSKVTIGPRNPNILCVSPSVRGRGTTNQNVVLYGGGITTGSTVHFANPGITVKSVSVPSSGQLAATISVSQTAALGSSGVTVTNPDNTTVSCSSCFTVTDSPKPTSVDPSSFARGSGPTSAGLFGAAFAQLATVTVPGGGVTVTVNEPVATPGRLDITVTVASGAATGTRDVIVVNADGGRGTCSKCLTVT
jgi:hypothetical protein